MSTTGVSLDAAVSLAHALVSHISHSAGIRCLFIKGPACALQGLRSDTAASSDVDAWVEPEREAELTGLLEAMGWRKRPKSELDTFYPEHSRTLYHPEWPCDIDVHTRFPGMEGRASSVFETIWARHSTVELAHQPVPVPRVSDHALILALHALRTPWSEKGRRDLEHLLHLHVDGVSYPELEAIASLTGATGAAGPFLDRLEDAPATPRQWPSPSDEWLVRTIARSPGSLRLIDILKAPWREKPRRVVNALFPRQETYTARNLHLDIADRQTRSRARIARLRSGLASVPSAISETRRYLEAKRSERR